MGSDLGHMRVSNGDNDGGHYEKCMCWCMTLGRVRRESLSQRPSCGSGDRALLLCPAVPMKSPFQFPSEWPVCAPRSSTDTFSVSLLSLTESQNMPQVGFQERSGLQREGQLSHSTVGPTAGGTWKFSIYIEDRKRNICVLKM